MKNTTVRELVRHLRKTTKPDQEILVNGKPFNVEDVCHAPQRKISIEVTGGDNISCPYCEEEIEV